jgi:hypothetical protein
VTDRPVLDHWRTSESDPYPVDWVDLRHVPGLAAEAAASGGRLGMSFAPGKVDPYWRHERDLAADVERMRDVHGVDALVLLVEDGEASALRIEPLPEVAAAAGIELLRHPIADFGVPRDLDAFHDLVDDVLTRVRAGDRVVIACKGGFGRTGAVTGAILREAGLDADEAVGLVRTTRPGTIEAVTQIDFVRAWPEPAPPRRL